MQQLKSLDKVIQVLDLLIKACDEDDFELEYAVKEVKALLQSY